MSETRGRQFFEQIAEHWDEIRALDESRLERLMVLANIAPGDRVLDVGCGTGVLTPLLSRLVGKTGFVVGIDYAQAMIKQARAKHPLPNVSYHVGDIWTFSPPIHAFDKIVCLNFFPHITEKEQFLLQLRSLLADGGCLPIMHDISRDTVNAIHRDSGEAVKDHRLPTASQVAVWLLAAGYQTLSQVDDQEMYLVSARKLPLPSESRSAME